jgi:hypothetical protein
MKPSGNSDLRIIIKSEHKTFESTIYEYGASGTNLTALRVRLDRELNKS